jgi:signal transduction histidine kinase
MSDQIVDGQNIAANARLPQSSEAALREAYQTLERKRQLAEGVHDILAILNSNRSLDAVLDYILTKASRLLGAEAAVVHHIDLAHRLLTIEASYGLPPELLAVRTFPLQAGRASDFLRAREPLVASDAVAARMTLYGDTINAEVPAPMRPVLADYHRSFLAVPIVVDDEVYGSLAFYTTGGRVFSRDDLSLALAFADQAALAIGNAQLRRRAEQAAVAAERSRLARDLHDAVTQTLFSASLVAEVLPRLWERNPPEARRRLEELRKLTRGALAEMRSLLVELRPAALTEVLLSDLLKQLAEAVGGRARIPIEVNFAGECVLPVETRIALYRIAQEALNNVAKHSGALHASVDFYCAPDKFCLRIADDGCGFDAGAVTAEHLGLDIMRERAADIGAALSIEAAPKQGTRIIVRGCAAQTSPESD